MTTQSLRGMANHGPMHWRGDRTGGNDAPTAQPDSGTFDERAAFKKFQDGVHRPARASTLHPGQRTWTRSPTSSCRSRIRRTRTGRSTTCSPPIRKPGASSSTRINCGIPQRLPGAGTARPQLLQLPHDRSERQSAAPRRPGSSARPAVSSFDFNPQLFKIPHLRNLYQKVGMFGNPANPGFLRERQRPQGRPGARLRVPPRRQHGYGVPLYAWDELFGMFAGPAARGCRSRRAARSSAGSSRPSSWRSRPTSRPSWASRSP